MGTCGVPGCNRSTWNGGHGLCQAHYLREWRTGTTNPKRPIGGSPLRWFCECGPKEQFDGLECTRCGRRPRRVMERSA